MKCIIIHGCVSDTELQWIEELIQHKASVFYRSKLHLNLDAVLHLKYINYKLFEARDVSWVGTLGDSFRGLRDHAIKSSGDFETRFYFLHNIENQDVLKLKNLIRSRLDLGNHSVHSTESYEELKEVANFVCHPLVKAHITNLRYSVNFDILNKIGNVYWDLKSSGIDNSEALVIGSAILEVFSLRKARDIDVILFCHEDKARIMPNTEFVSYSHVSQVDSETEFDKFLLDPYKYYRFCGMNLISLSELRSAKTRRSEFPKDYSDIHLIDSIDSKKMKSDFFVNLRKKILYRLWQISLFFSFLSQRFKSVLIDLPFMKSVIVPFFKRFRARSRSGT